MFILPVIIIISLTMYIYYKVRILRMNHIIEQYYTNAKARIALGLFITAFGINQYIYYQTQISLFIGILFITLGVYNISFGWKSKNYHRQKYQEYQVSAKN